MAEPTGKGNPGTPVAAADKPAAPAAKKAEPPSTAAAKPGAEQAGPPSFVPRRRRIVWACVVGYLVTNFLMFLRFFLPRTLFEPKTQFVIGYPNDFALGVETKFQKDYRIWVVRNAERVFVIYARCTHLGCTPDWKPGENKFKCPCHGSGYDTEGVNFEGPAPRPMDRAHVELNAEGQILVDTARLYQWPKGMQSHFNDPGAYVPV